MRSTTIMDHLAATQGDLLGALFLSQAALQREAYGVDPEALSDELRANYIAVNVLALTDELHEALAEVGWKPWATSRHVNREAFLCEMADALHFFINLCLAAGISAVELTAAYAAKETRNRARQQQGYDGVNDKCPQCRRALDDPATTCSQQGCDQ